MTNQDLYLVIGIILVGFSLPSIIGALMDRRAPRVGAIVFVIGGGLIAMAITQAPGVYDLEEVPEAFIRVVAYFIR